MIVYRVQYRDESSTVFVDEGDWSTCEECIRKMRAIFDVDHRRDVRVIDDRGIVVASTAGQSASTPLTGSLRDPQASREQGSKEA